MPVTLEIAPCAAPVAPVVPDLTGNNGDPAAFTSDPFTGTGPLVLNEADLPGGMTFTDNGDGTFTIGGVFPAAGTTAVTVTATGPCGSDDVIFDVISS